MQKGIFTHAKESPVRIRSLGNLARLRFAPFCENRKTGKVGNFEIVPYIRTLPTVYRQIVLAVKLVKRGRRPHKTFEQFIVQIEEARARVTQNFL